MPLNTFICDFARCIHVITLLASLHKNFSPLSPPPTKPSFQVSHLPFPLFVMLLCFLYIRATTWPSTVNEVISHLSAIKRRHIRKEKYVLKRGYINSKKFNQNLHCHVNKYETLKTKIIHTCI